MEEIKTDGQTISGDNLQDLLEKARQALDSNKLNVPYNYPLCPPVFPNVCPHCGYCPHCGRRTRDWPNPYYEYWKVIC